MDEGEVDVDEAQVGGGGGTLAGRAARLMTLR